MAVLLWCSCVRDWPPFSLTPYAVLYLSVWCLNMHNICPVKLNRPQEIFDRLALIIDEDEDNNDIDVDN